MSRNPILRIIIEHSGSEVYVEYIRRTSSMVYSPGRHTSAMLESYLVRKRHGVSLYYALIRHDKVIFAFDVDV